MKVMKQGATMITTPTTVRKGRIAVIEPQRKQLILNFIHEYRRIHQISPSYTEIAVGIGYTASAGGSVHTLVEQLIAEGWLRRAHGNAARTILPTYADPNREYCPITDPALKRIARRQHDLNILKG
jgi:SOS-response transcriptional repressor LexA